MAACASGRRIARRLRIAEKGTLRAFKGLPFTTTLERWGGTSQAVWSLVHGQNSSWLSIGPNGELTGTPSAAGPVSFTVRVEEPTFSGNRDEKLISFEVVELSPGHYFEDEVGVCPSGWTLRGDWQCGTPTAGPSGCRSGSTCFGTVLDGNHSLRMDKTHENFLRTPPIHIPATSVQPVLSFWGWVETLAANYAGFTVYLRGGTESLLLVDPPHTHTSGKNHFWGGDRSQLGWQRYAVDLSDHVGETIELEFRFYSSKASGMVDREGVHIDDVEVLELSEIVPAILETPYHDAFVSQLWTKRMATSGGFRPVQWSIVGGTNHGWLSIDQEGVLSGFPASQNVGPVTVTVRAEVASDPSKADERTLTFDVRSGTPYFYSGFEGVCPAGWSLAGDWQCGVPIPAAQGEHDRPAVAYAGSHVLATQLADNHNTHQNWVGARSPTISLAGATNPVAYFRMWMFTWGLNDSGMNLKVVTNGTPQLHSDVDPSYFVNLPSPAQLGWGGDHAGSGWRLVRVDLSAYAGQDVQLEFSFRAANSSIRRPGVYIDEVIVMEE